MNRKIIGVCAALVAFAAFAIAPAMSSGAGLRDTPTNELIPAGTKIVAYNEEGEPTKLNASGLNVFCSEAKMTGSVHSNLGGANSVFGTIEDVWFRGDAAETKCTDEFGGVATVTIPGMTNEGGTQHWCIRTVAEKDEFEVEPHGCTATGGEFTFIIHALGMTCGFHRTANIKGTFTTDTGEHKAVTLKMNDGQEFTTDNVSGHSIFCPANGKLETFHFQMYTDKSATGPAWRPAEDVAAPVYITKE